LPTGKAGTMVLVHFDLWHKASLNRSDLDRFMLKFQFVRTEVPAEPSWHHADANLRIPDGLPYAHPDLWQDIWDWLRGESNDGGKRQSGDAHTGLIEALDGPEPEALNAAYALGRRGGEPGIRALADAIGNGPQLAADRAAYGISAAGAQAVPL